MIMNVDTTAATLDRLEEAPQANLEVDGGSAGLSLNSSGDYDDDDDQSSVANSEHHHKDDKLSELEAERRTLARNENKAVSMLRVMVFLVLSITASIVAIGVHRYIANDQQMDFENDFDANAERLLESFHESIERKLEAIDALGVTMTSYAMNTKSSWPNVTLPDFAVRVANTRILSNGVVVNFHPLVTDETRAGWEAYQLETRDTYDAEFVEEQTQQALQDIRFNRTVQTDSGGARRLQQEPQDVEEAEGKVDEEVELDMLGLPLRNSIENMLPDGSTVVAPEESGPYMPVWQISPVVPMKSVLNFNALSHPSAKGAYREMIRTEQAVIDIADNLNQENLGQSGAFFQLLLSMSQYRGSIERFLGEPTSALAYPVFDSLNPTTRKLAGMIVMSVYWRVNFQNVLPPNARGIICVISNTLNQTFTYRVDGDEPTFLGNGDWHDSKYDALVRSADVTTYLKGRKSIETRSYSSVDLNDEYCGYSINVYPSSDTEAEFINDQPLVFTMVVVCIFCFTSLVFVMYDCIVARRQQIVMDRAVASSAIVSSLFPSQVRNQIYQESKAQHEAAMEYEQAKSQKYNPDLWKVDPSQQQSHLPGGQVFQNGPASSYTKPIANLFENTTVMFADMAGFTAWSASRTPEQVFELLERVYSAFDKIAERRKVFKVETIGDCYVAVTGLPEPQEDHAIIMAKFAREIMSKMINLTRDLAGTLGQDTTKLQMRVGLHSGNVTGGVLRGQKSRFQLFGDTMNTASRMETNGAVGKIHVSQATADELSARGKSHWVTPRQDKIVAKGKGELQTYWVSVRDKTATMSLASARLDHSKDFHPPQDSP